MAATSRARALSSRIGRPGPSEFQRSHPHCSDNQAFLPPLRAFQIGTWRRGQVSKHPLAKNDRFSLGGAARQQFPEALSGSRSFCWCPHSSGSRTSRANCFKQLNLRYACRPALHHNQSPAKFATWAASRALAPSRAPACTRLARYPQLPSHPQPDRSVHRNCANLFPFFSKSAHPISARVTNSEPIFIAPGRASAAFQFRRILANRRMVQSFEFPPHSVLRKRSRTWLAR